MGKAIKSFTKMVDAKVSKEKEKVKRHTDIKGMFKPIPKKNKTKPKNKKNRQIDGFFLINLDCVV